MSKKSSKTKATKRGAGQTPEPADSKLIPELAAMKLSPKLAAKLEALSEVIGKVTMADEIATQKAIGAAKEAFNTFSQSSKEYRMDCLQRVHDAVAKRMDQLVEATVVEYGAPQDRAKGSNLLAANIFLHFKKVRPGQNCRHI